MSIFNPTLETEIAFEQPIKAPRQYSPIADLANTATNALRTFAPTKTQASFKQEQLATFGAEIQRAMDLKEQGKPYQTRARQAAIQLVTSGITDVPDELKDIFRGVTGIDFESIGYEDQGEYQRSQLLASEEAMSLATAVKVRNPNFTQDEIDQEVLETLSEIQFHDLAVQRQNLRAQRGLPVETTPIVQSIQNDFSILSAKVAEYQQDGIITREEYLSATTSVRSLIATKYANFNGNTEVKAVQDQMFGMLDDIGKGVSTDPLEVQLDAVQVALTQANFNPATIATIRSLVKTNPQKFNEIISQQLGERGDSFVDALSQIWKAPSSEMTLENIFNNRPQIGTGGGENPSLMSIPTPDEDPIAYSRVLEGLSLVTNGTLPSAINNSEATRNEWLNHVNITASLVASQSEDKLLGENLLKVFAADGILGNLKVVYNLDPLNAGQTNLALQEALSSERNRQKLELDQRLATGDGEYFVVDANTGNLDINMETFRQRATGDVQGQKRLAEIARIRSEINRIGGLERFFQLPDTAKDDILQGSNFARIFDVRFGQTLKLVRNLKLIDNKVQKLSDLAEKYSSATDVMTTTLGDETQQTDVTTEIPEINLDDAAEVGTQSNPHNLTTEEQVNELPTGSHFTFAGSVDPSGNLIVYIK